MKDITVIIPLHKVDSGYTDMLKNAVDNVNNMVYDGNINIMVVLPEGYDYPVFESKHPINFVQNPGATDYCSQINFGVQNVKTEYFTIMEVDDHYNLKWLNMFNTYLNTHEDVSVFLPINVVHNLKTNEREFVNDIAWATSFAEDQGLGFITFNDLQYTASFNLTGGIFKTSDWIGYKPSIKLAFNYEYLLRATHKNQKVYVVPKEGYYHKIFREGSLVDNYISEIPEEDTQLWFELAKREYAYDEDRNNNIIRDKQDELK